jgi:flagellar FliL protein
MAEEETKEEEQEQGQKKSSNMLMIIIIAVLVLIIVIGAVLAVVLMNSEEEQSAKQSTYQTQGQPVAAQTTRRSSTADPDLSRRLSEIGILYPLDTFTVNLKSDAGRRYLKATISLELSGEELSIELDAKAPVVRDRIIRILTSKTLEEISSKKGKQKVSNQIMDTLNAIVSDGTVQGIYFTEFVIQ